MTTSSDVIQAAIDEGYGILASILGKTASLYRPTDFANAVTDASLISNSVAIYTDPSENFSAEKANGYEKMVWALSIDRNTVGSEVGDYLVAPTGTYFIIEQQPIVPTLCVLCNRTISVYRPTAADATTYTDPSDFYFGNTQLSNGVSNLGNTLMSHWPAAIMSGTKGSNSEVELPLEEKMPWALITFPYSGVVLDYIRATDLIVDDMGRRWVVSGSELTALGYKITASYQNA